MTLIEFPGNRQQVFAIDPVRVTAVAPYRATLLSRGAQLFDMSVIWIDNHTSFISSWKVDHVLQVLNEARAPLAKAFEAGYAAGIADDRMTADARAAWESWLGGGKS